MPPGCLLARSTNPVGALAGGGELGDERRPGPGAQLGPGADLGEAPLLQHRHPVAQRLCVAPVVGDHQAGQPQLAEVAPQERADLGPRADVERIVRIFEKHGALAKISSIHVNGWFGTYDKLTTSKAMMRELFGVDLERERDAYVFSGDSPNDAPMFGFFPNGVGVANVRDFADLMPHLPRWITTARSGAGFVELARALVAARRR